MPEYCEHNQRTFDNRLEYCEVEAADPEGDASVVIEGIDALLYQDDCTEKDNCFYKTDSSGQSFNRVFSYTRQEEDSYVHAPVETRVSVSHQMNRESETDFYTVEVTWQVAGWESEDDCFTTTYFIDSYPQGDVQGILEQPDVTTGKSEVRNMTTYDYEQLFNELATLREASLAGHDEDAENS